MEKGLNYGQEILNLIVFKSEDPTWELRNS